MTTRRRRRNQPRRRRDERGFVAGLEGVLFAVLILLVGTLIVVNAWSVLQTRRTLDGAAREYLRAYTEGDGPDDAVASGRRALAAVLSGESRIGSHGPAVRIDGPDPGRFGPCVEAEVAISAVVPAARIPFVGTFGSTTVRVTHTELVDAHREVDVGPAYDPEQTPCGR